jgi:hypothetical protein
MVLIVRPLARRAPNAAPVYERLSRAGARIVFVTLLASPLARQTAGHASTADTIGVMPAHGPNAKSFTIRSPR